MTSSPDPELVHADAVAVNRQKRVHAVTLHRAIAPFHLFRCLQKHYTHGFAHPAIRDQPGVFSVYATSMPIEMRYAHETGASRKSLQRMRKTAGSPADKGRRVMQDKIARDIDAPSLCDRWMRMHRMRV